VPGAEKSEEWDRYAYTTNNPLRYTDPTGHRNCLEDGYNCPGDKPPYPKPPQRRTTLSVHCGRGISGMSGPGMNCGPGPADEFQMPIWNSSEVPGFNFVYTPYPGYGHDIAGNPIKSPSKDNGKAQQAKDSYNKTSTTSNLVNIGYSAGVEAALFATELRQRNGRSTSALVLIGPNFPDGNLFSVDPDGVLVYAPDFVARVAAVSQYTPVLIIDDTNQYKELFETHYPNANVTVVSAYKYNSTASHEGLDETPWILGETINWLSSIGVR
jgi:pimeloyl-ACP methyl ester carboxylesterase